MNNPFASAITEAELDGILAVLLNKPHTEVELDNIYDMYEAQLIEFSKPRRITQNWRPRPNFNKGR